MFILPHNSQRRSCEWFRSPSYDDRVDTVPHRHDLAWADKRIGKTNESGVVKIGPTGGVREAGWCVRLAETLAWLEDITNALDDINFAKYCKGDKNVVGKLPSNTYVAEFAGDQDAASSKQLVDHVSGQLDRMFRAHGVRGNHFGVVGARWAWHRESF